MSERPRKRLRRLASIDEEYHVQSDKNTDRHNAHSNTTGKNEGGNFSDIEIEDVNDEDGVITAVARRTTRSMSTQNARAGTGKALEKSTNEDVSSGRTRNSRRKMSSGVEKGKGKVGRGLKKKDEGSTLKISGDGRKKRRNVTAELEVTTTAPLAPTSSITGKTLKPISSFLGARTSSSQQRQSSLPPSTATIQAKRITSRPIAASQTVVLEDLDDLIQDWDSDGIEDDEDEIMGSMRSTIATNGVKREMVVSQGNNGKLHSLGSQAASYSGSQISASQSLRKAHSIFKQSSQASTATAAVQTDSTLLPWPMKHAPITSTGLAVNKKKVEEVSNWLNNVYSGWSRKRVLILRGPAGCGKSATLNALAKEGGWEVVEWGNPTGGGGGSGAWNNSRGNDTIDDLDYDKNRGGGMGEGFASIFEDWLFRSGTWGCLDLASSSGTLLNPMSSLVTSTAEHQADQRKLLLIEDLPNLSHQGTLKSFRTAIRSYLSLSSPPPGSPLPPIPPLVIIVSEISEGAGSSSTMGMSVYKMFGTQILSHPLLSQIKFQKVAKTFLVKCMDEVLRREGYAGMFGKDILEKLAEIGDLRAALGGLEMLVLGRGRAFLLSQAKKKTTKRKKDDSDDFNVVTVGKELLDLLTPRFSTLGIFHSIGKVVYNKRYGDYSGDPYKPPPPRPDPHISAIHRYHSRPMKLDPNTILDESGVDAGMFMYGIQENYLGSCNTLGGGRDKAMEDVLEDVCFCAQGLSDGDALMGSISAFLSGGGDLGAGIPRPGGWSRFSGHSHDGEGMIRQEEIAAQVVVRSMALGLPSPVKRDSVLYGSGSSTRNNGGALYYPMGPRLWRVQEEIEAVIELWEGWVREGRVGIGGTRVNGMMPMAGLAKSELVLERLPFMTQIARGKTSKRTGQGQFTKSVMGGGIGWDVSGSRNITVISPASAPLLSIIHSLEKITVFRGLSVKPSEQFGEESDLTDLDNESFRLPELLGLDGLRELDDTSKFPFSTDSTTTAHNSQRKTKPSQSVPQFTNMRGKTSRAAGLSDTTALNAGVESLILEDDDIEDPDDW